jgi:hypothetical protein
MPNKKIGVRTLFLYKDDLTPILNSDWRILMTMLPTVEPWVVPGENVDNPGGVPNVNPLDTLSSDLHPWGGRIPMLEYGAPDYEQYGEVCGSEGPDGGEWAC